jgi:hypothetical protein
MNAVIRSRKALLAGLALTVAIVLFGAGCSSDDDSPTDANSSNPGEPTTTASATPTTAASVEDAILADYMRYWDAYSAAALNLDASLVEGFAAGAELESIRAELVDLRSQGVALRVVLTHDPVVVEISGDTAILMDEMVNNSFYVDPVTKEPPAASGSGEVLKDTFHLEHVDGRWVVTESSRQR